MTRCLPQEVVHGLQVLRSPHFPYISFYFCLLHQLKASPGATGSLPPQSPALPIPAGGTPNPQAQEQQGLNLIQGVRGEWEAKISFMDHRWGPWIRTQGPLTHESVFVLLPH